jgi:aminomethyltransferase
VNAANTEQDLAWVQEVHEATGLGCEVIDESSSTALLAVQGPSALEIVGKILPDGAAGPARWHFMETRLANIPVVLSRTGYTGEDGYEIYVGTSQALALWDLLREAGGERLQLAGLGARDTLRTEMAYPLYGHELDRTRNPIQAGLERFVAFGSGFIGEEALRRVQEAGSQEFLVGLLLEGRQVARNGYSILGEDRVGTITSGTYGPSVEQSIAIGYVRAHHAAVGCRLQVAVRNRRVPCEVIRTPFYSKQVRKG